jgi:hypothetical protein
MSKVGEKNTNPSEGKYVFQSYRIGELEGRILTFIDASISDPVQRKALKDLLRPMIWNWAGENNRESCYEIKSKSVGDTPMGKGSTN